VCVGVGGESSCWRACLRIAREEESTKLFAGCTGREGGTGAREALVLVRSLKMGLDGWREEREGSDGPGGWDLLGTVVVREGMDWIGFSGFLFLGWGLREVVFDGAVSFEVVSLRKLFSLFYVDDF